MGLASTGARKRAPAPDGAFKHVPEGNILPQGQFIWPEDVKWSGGSPRKAEPFMGWTQGRRAIRTPSTCICGTKSGSRAAIHGGRSSPRPPSPRHCAPVRKLVRQSVPHKNGSHGSAKEKRRQCIRAPCANWRRALSFPIAPCYTEAKGGWDHAVLRAVSGGSGR